MELREFVVFSLAYKCPSAYSLYLTPAYCFVSV